MKKIFNTTVPVKEGASRSVLRGIIQYDTLNEVNIRLSDGSRAFDYTGYTNIIFKVLKADGTAYIDSEGENVIATSPIDGIVTVNLNGQATTAAGLCQSVIEIYSGEDKMTTARFNYEVFEDLDLDDAEVSETQYPVFQNLMADLSALEASIETAEAARVVAETARADEASGYVAKAEKAAADAEMWAKVSKNATEGDFATRAELESVKVGAAQVSAILLGEDDDINTITASGWYAWTGSAPVNAPIVVNTGNKYGYMRVDSASSDDCCQTIFSKYGAGYNVAVTRQRSGAWGEWEYVNPPMKEGVEYRTTERYLGKPVYVKVCSFGQMPNAGVLEKKFGLEDVDTLVSYSGITSNKTVIPCSCPSSSSVGTVSLYCNAYGTTYITTTTDWSESTANIVLKYTKTTDT